MQARARERSYWRGPYARLAISAGVVLPFLLLEVFAAKTPLARFPFSLFVFLCGLAFSFSAILASLTHRLRRPDELAMVSVAAAGALLLVVGCVWVAVVIDQMPCFLGVPNCD